MRKRVLVADDDASIRESLGKLLEETGYEVLLAADGEGALRTLETESADLLLLDLEMPGRDGWDVLEVMLGRRSLLPIIVITGRADELDTRMIPGPGALLDKPVEVAVLLKKIGELLAEGANSRAQRTRTGQETATTLGETPGYLGMSQESPRSHHRTKGQH